MKRHLPLHTLCSLLALLSLTAAAEEATVFERVFGIPRILPQAAVDAVLALPEGEKLQRDTNGDGVVDELWYLDTATRHNVSPLLVRVLDEDGDLAKTGRGDRDSDCYFWDHDADGRVDVVTDYQDDDGDGDVDQMGIFYDKKWQDEEDALTVWWAVDVGDDNRLWFDVNGNYYQRLCQWRTHFGGDELFYQFRLTPYEDRWLNVWEDPFAFYDPDQDGSSEMVIRISAVGNEVENLRYSIDADDDAYGDRTRDYDFSVTALPPENGLTTDPAMTTNATIRGIETYPVLRWDLTPLFAQQANWGKAMLIWDEINSNTDQDPDQDPHERWEGLLNHASKDGSFPQVGGPPCSAFNKRFEVAHDPSSPLQLYWDDADHRFHLLGAAYGYLDVDYDYDGDVDAAYTWKDNDGDGILDIRRVDVDADGTIDFEHPMRPTDQRFPLSFEAIAPVYTKALEEVAAANQRFFDAAMHAVSLGKVPPADVDEVWHFFQEELPKYHPETELGEYIRKTPAGVRLYAELLRDRMYLHAREKYRDLTAWNAVEKAFLEGRVDDAASRVASMLEVPLTQRIHERVLVHDKIDFTERLTLRVTASPGRDIPISIDVERLREQAPNFNPRNCRVVDGNLWVARRVIPHQVDDFALGGQEQLSFLADISAHKEKTYYLYYNPDGVSSPDFPKLTNAVLETPPYVAWESDAGAYRTYTGQIDFYGKHVWRDLPREERLFYPLIDVNHHVEQAWGMDALHVNTSSGLGGLTLYRENEAFPVQSPAGEGYVNFEYNVVGAGPVRAAAEYVATNVFQEDPEAAVIVRCFIYARHAESEVQVQLPEGYTDLEIAPGLMHVSDAPAIEPEHRFLADWGYHGDDIGEIGLAVVVPKESAGSPLAVDQETRLRAAPAEGPVHLRYWILGDWRRGMKYPVAPTREDWVRTVERLAEQLQKTPHVTVVAEDWRPE